MLGAKVRIINQWSVLKCFQLPTEMLSVENSVPDHGE
jgi:hypothetical protein